MQVVGIIVLITAIVVVHTYAVVIVVVMMGIVLSIELCWVQDVLNGKG